jgi:hypothetical protein
MLKFASPHFGVASQMTINIYVCHDEKNTSSFLHTLLQNMTFWCNSGLAQIFLSAVKVKLFEK